MNDRMSAASTRRLRRRCFLTQCGCLGLGSTLFPGALWARSQEAEQAITVEMIDYAARLAGLEFSAADRTEMAATINANLASFEALRQVRIDQNVPPPLYFNPAVPGLTFDDERRPFAPSAPPEVVRPSRLEDVAFWSVTRLARLLESRQATSVELTRMYLDRLRRYDPILECVITLTPELAIEQAERADREIASGRYRGPLHGIPWGVKDLFAKRGYPTTWGSEPYREQRLDLDATVVTRLEDAGAVLVAKLSTGELARGDRWFGGQTRNPWKPEEGSGGSSAGPAAATAAGLVGFAVGTETTGSIVGPSRTCGITGMRPTFGRVSRHGVMPVSWSLDKAGPMCRTVEDCAVVFHAIYGPDGLDLAVVDRPFNWDVGLPIESLCIGYLQEAFDAERRNPAEEKARANESATLETMRRSLGIELHAVSFPEHAGMDALQMLLVDEAAAFDELVQSGRVDLLIQDRDEPEDMLMRTARLMPAVEYVQMNRLRMLMMQDMAVALRDIDVFVAPHGGGPINSATNLTGHPAVTVPNGFTDAGTPTGILFVGKLYGEAEMLAVARAYQEATEFHRRHPSME